MLTADLDPSALEEACVVRRAKFNSVFELTSYVLGSEQVSFYLPELVLTPNCEDPSLELQIESISGPAGQSLLDEAIDFDAESATILILSENFALINETATVSVIVVPTDDTELVNDPLSVEVVFYGPLP